MPAVENCRGEHAGSFGGELSLKSEVGRQVIDGAAQRGGRDRLRGRQRRAALDAAVRTVIGTILTLDAVAAREAAERFGLRRGGGKTPPRLGMSFLIDDQAGNPGRRVIDRDGITISGLLECGV